MCILIVQPLEITQKPTLVDFELVAYMQHVNTYLLHVDCSSWIQHEFSNQDFHPPPREFALLAGVCVPLVSGGLHHFRNDAYVHMPGVAG